MKITLRVIAVYFAIAFVGSLLEVVRFAFSVSPAALRNLGIIGVLTLVGWALGIFIGPFAAIQLWRLKNIGRIAGAVLFGYVAVYGVLDAAYYGQVPLPLLVKIVINAVGCAILLSPGARRVCTDDREFSANLGYSS